MVIVPVAAAVVTVGVFAMKRGADRELACWVLPNARVMVTPGDDDCPLRLHDQILRLRAAGPDAVAVGDSRALAAAVMAAGSSVRVAVMRERGEQWVDVPVREITSAKRLARVAAAALVACALMVFPLLVLWHSRSSAAFPFGLLYSAAAVVAVTLVAGRQSEWLTRASLIAMASAPAVLAHLSFTFPRERRLIREAPALVAVPYAASGFLVTAGWFALDRDALLWPAFMYLLLVLTGGGWLILVFSCGFAIRESTSELERARARVLCYGTLFLPLIPTLVVSRGNASAAETATVYLWMTAVVIPLPIGLAISRYNLFNLEWDVRHWVGRLLYLGSAALVVSLAFEAAFRITGSGHPLGGPALLFLVSFGCVSAIELLRDRMLGLLESMLVPRLDRLRRVRERFEREVVQLHEMDEVARHLGDVLRAALVPRSGCVFLVTGGKWHPAYAFGVEAPTRIALATASSSALGEGGPIHLPLEPEVENGAHAVLREAGVEIVALVESGGERRGLVLLGGGERRSPYTGLDLDFVGTVTSIAGIALRNAQLTKDLLSVERHATTGRVALELAHDLGKELDWMDRLVKRLPKHVEDRTRLLRDISMIQEFTQGLVAALRGFVGEATEPVAEGPGIVRLDELIEQATRRTSRIHGADRVTQSVAPAARSARCHENLGRVIANLLDNALRATRDGEGVHLFATVEGRSLRLVVRDRGCGIPEDLLSEVFKPGFSTRLEQGGLGIGLTVSREIVDALGGTIELSGNDGGGTLATVLVPAISVDLT